MTLSRPALFKIAHLGLKQIWLRCRKALGIVGAGLIAGFLDRMEIAAVQKGEPEFDLKW